MVRRRTRASFTRKGRRIGASTRFIKRNHMPRKFKPVPNYDEPIRLVDPGDNIPFPKSAEELARAFMALGEDYEFAYMKEYGLDPIPELDGHREPTDPVDDEDEEEEAD